ncbi:MAG: 50S ribosomal protein L25/general stress protein Ctc [Candidatus Methylacidiphilales bacterium]
MSKSVGLKAKPRQSLGRNRVKALRRAGTIPAILYGGPRAQALEIKGTEIVAALHGAESEHILVNLEIEGETGGSKHLAVIQHVQIDPLKDRILHLDLHELDESKPMHAEVPVHEFGECIGVKNGGILDHLVRTIRVECLPKDLPEVIRVDVSELGVGQSIHVKDLPLPAGVKAMHDSDLTIMIVHEPKVSEVAAEVAAQPEVITAKKDEGSDKK